MLFVGPRIGREGRVLPGGRLSPIWINLDIREKKFAEMLEDSETCPARMQPRCSGRRLLLCDKLPTDQTQYRLQIAEGVLKLLESYQYRTDFDYHRTNDGH